MSDAYSDPHARDRIRNADPIVAVLETVEEADADFLRQEAERKQRVAQIVEDAALHKA